MDIGRRAIYSLKVASQVAVGVLVACGGTALHNRPLASFDFVESGRTTGESARLQYLYHNSIQWHIISGVSVAVIRNVDRFCNVIQLIHFILFIIR